VSGDAATDGLLALCDQLDQAREEATPGPWMQAGEHLIVDGRGVNVIATNVGVEDAALIVAAVVGSYALTDAVRRLLADRDTDRERLRRVEKLAVQYKRLGEELHEIPRAESFADAALDLRRALGEPS